MPQFWQFMAGEPAAAYSQRVSHQLVPAPSGRSKCRGCGQPIAQGEMRFGATMPNAFGGGEMTLWFHPLCAAYKFPDAILEIADSEALKSAALQCKEHPRLARIGGAERSKSGQAACRHCQEPIEKGSWRIRLVYNDEGRLSPGGYIHARCSSPYFETPGILQPILQLTPGLDESDRQGLSAAIQ